MMVGRAAEFGGNDDQCGIEQAALAKIVEQRAECLVEYLAVLCDGAEVVEVSVPIAETDFDESQAVLHEAAGQQAALAERARAVFGARRGWFFADVERL